MKKTPNPPKFTGIFVAVQPAEEGNLKKIRFNVAVTFDDGTAITKKMWMMPVSIGELFDHMFNRTKEAILKTIREEYPDWPGEYGRHPDGGIWNFEITPKSVHLTRGEEEA